MAPKLLFSKDELHIILNLRNLEIGENLSFLLLTKLTMELRSLKNTLLSLLVIPIKQLRF